MVIMAESVAQMRVSASTLAEILGLDVSMVRKLDKEGVLEVINQEGKTRHVYGLGVSVRRFVAYQVGLAESDSPLKDDMARARLRKVNIEIDREQLKLDVD